VARRDVSRRDFLRTTGVLGAGLLAGGALAGCRLPLPGPGRRPRRGLLDGPAADAPVTHVVVAMMENRSFDHWFGWLANDPAYLEAGRRRYGPRFGVDGTQQLSYPDPDGRMVPTRHLFAHPEVTNPWRGCEFADPGHSWNAGRVQRDRGFLAPGSNNDELALGYYRGDDDLPFSARCARRFTIFDAYHCSILGPTYPNREYLHSGQSGGYKTNYLPIAEGGFSWPTIWDRLLAAGVPCGYYYTDLPVTLLWGNRLLGINRSIDDYFTDCAAGRLPNVTFIDPKFLGHDRSDDHPLADIRAGQRFLRDTFQAFAASPHWHSGVFIVTYDEWGGFFDHVRPPVLPDDRASDIDANNFGQTGFRVPTMMASPFARPGYVDPTVYDHTSILRFIEWRFLGAPPHGPGRDGDTWFLTTRDRHAANIGASLLRRRWSSEVGFDLDAPIGEISPPCLSETGGALAAPPAAGTLHRLQVLPPTHDHAFDEEAWRRYLDRLGAPAPA
jgi:phospholipase C